MNKITNYIAIFALITTTFSCAGDETTRTNEKIVICTTETISDAIKNILPSTFKVKALMGPGVDPHTYKSKSSDLKGLLSADAIVYNGIHFEANLIDAIHNMSKKQFVIGLGNILPQERLRSTTDFGTAYDPHYWHDVNLFATSINMASKLFVKQFPENAHFIDSATAVYIAKLKKTEEFVTNQLKSIPDSSRVIITAHDAFGYYGRAFNIEVRGVQGISTSADISIRGITDLTDFIVDRKIKAIFVENSVSEKNIKSVSEGCEAKGHVLKQGGTLFSDGLGDEKSGANTYIKMIKKNTTTIVEALKQ